MCERRSALQRRLLLTAPMPRLRTLPSRYSLQCRISTEQRVLLAATTLLLHRTMLTKTSTGVTCCASSTVQVQQQAVPKTQEATQQYLKDPAARAADQVRRQVARFRMRCADTYRLKLISDRPVGRSVSTGSVRF